jgi:hypothetical protein
VGGRRRGAGGGCCLVVGVLSELVVCFSSTAESEKRVGAS